MKKRDYLCSIVVIMLVTAGGTVLADKPKGSAYKDGGNVKIGVLLCHGRGKDPRWNVVNPLRKAINKKLGYHTLSLQMPADEDKKAREYAEDFTRAYEIIQAGIDFLKNEKGVT